MAHRLTPHASLITHHVSRLTFYVSRHQHFALILVVFLTFRLLLPFVFRNGSFFVETAPDLADYLQWGTLADSGLYPFIDYWSEYPPLFAWSVIGLYRISALLPAWIDQRLWFAIVMQIAMVVADAGSLVLIYAISRQWGSQARAVRASALFAGSFIAAYAASGWYEPVPVFLMLLALYLALRDRFGWSLLVIGVGFLSKIAPLAIAPAVLKRMRQRRQQAVHIVWLAAVIIALLLPFLLTGADYLLAFARATLNRPTWLSLWALLDGNYQYGATLSIAERFSPDQVGAPDTSSLPWPIIHLAFLAIVLFIYTRRTGWRAPGASVAFAGLTVNLLLLWSKGFSGQFIAYTIPFIILLMPNLRGALCTALLSIVWVAEWPIAFQPLENQNWFIAWLVLVRTAILIALCLEYTRFIFPTAAPRFTFFTARATTAILLVSWLSLAPVTLAAVSAYTQARLAADPAAPALDLIRSSDDRVPRTIVFATPRLYRKLYPLARSSGEVWLLPTARHVPEERRIAWLQTLAARGPFWFVFDESDPETWEESRRGELWLSQRACKVATQIAGAARVSRFIAAPQADTAVFGESDAIFADELHLTGFGLSGQTLPPGGALCVALNWEALQAPAADYTVFVHFIDAQGRLVAQNDQPPQGGFAPTSGWSAGSQIADRHGMLLPGDLPGGEYVVRVGLYRSDNQAPVLVTRGERMLPDASAIVLTSVRVQP
ncbi:MAG TPA: hypothetical protein VJG32_09420 [Anaerolineae bacterium]|nr:hypothetical protein [Anaerolineae bacterium]